MSVLFKRCIVFGSSFQRRSGPVRFMSSEEADYNLPEDPSSPKRKYEKCINEVTLLGRVGVHPQLRGSDERPCVTFSLATDRNVKNLTTNEFNSYTDWHNVAVFKNGLRQTVYEGISKGQRCLVQGRIQYATIEDKMGVTRNAVSIVAENVIGFKQ